MIPGTWQTVLIVTLLLALIAGSLTLRPKKRGARRVKSEQPKPRVADYSAAREKAIAWLGDRYLLARPINRMHRPELPAMLRRQAN